MIAQSDSRSAGRRHTRTAGLISSAGVLSLVLGGVALVLAAGPPATAKMVATGNLAADPPGNNGTIKIEGTELGSEKEEPSLPLEDEST